MAPDVRRMNDLLALSHVPRWVIVSTVHPQSVADHSFRTAVIAYELYQRLRDSGSWGPDQLEIGEILWWALVHDGGESHTGDVPGHIKHGNPELVSAIHRVEQNRCRWMHRMLEPSPYVKCVVKIADMIETTTFMWMNKQGSHAGWVWRYMNGRLTDTVNACCETLGLPRNRVWPVVGTMVSDIQTEEGRLEP